jgi:ketosteroid isomerase-like protein
VSANLDLVRAIYTDWERGDFSHGEWADPEIEFVFIDGPEPGTAKGLVALAERTRDFLSPWQEARAEADRFTEVDGERVLVLVRRAARGKSSGVEVVEAAAELFEVRDAKVVKLVFYWDRERAFADLGVEG